MEDLQTRFEAENLNLTEELIQVKGEAQQEKFRVADRERQLQTLVNTKNQQIINLEMRVISLQDQLNTQEAQMQHTKNYINSRNMLRNELQQATHKIIELEELIAQTADDCNENTKEIAQLQDENKRLKVQVG
jgi:predicted phage tail protein